MMKGMESVSNIPHTDTLPRNTVRNTHNTRVSNELLLLNTIFLTLLQNCKREEERKSGEERKIEEKREEGKRGGEEIYLFCIN